VADADADDGDDGAVSRAGSKHQSGERFRCGHGIPVEPDAVIHEIVQADIVILPELWLGPDETMKGRYPALSQWIRARYEVGAHVYSACSGAVMLAETGLLDGRDATSHWGYQDLFRREYPRVRFHPEPNLCFGDPSGRIVTAGGTTSWHDLALHIIARHVSAGEAIRIAQVHLLKWHDNGQLPYEALVRQQPHAGAVVRGCEHWLKEHFREPGAVAGVVGHARVPERTVKRRFKAATGLAIIDYLQNLRKRPSVCWSLRTNPLTRSASQSGMKTPHSSDGCSSAGQAFRRAGTDAYSSRSTKGYDRPEPCVAPPSRVRRRSRTLVDLRVSRGQGRREHGAKMGGSLQSRATACGARPRSAG
jgi:transcriptional regulator GlxA family with amidase domain